MASPTYSGNPGPGPSLTVIDAQNCAGENWFSDYGYREAISLRVSKAHNFTKSDVHIIVGEGVPSAVATYDSAPLGSLYLNSLGGNAESSYMKEATGATGWAPITCGAQA